MTYLYTGSSFITWYYRRQICPFTVPFPYDITYWALSLFLSGTWATSGVLQIVMSQVKPPQNDHHNYLLHFHFLLEPIIFSYFKHVSFSYIIIGAIFNWIMRYKNFIWSVTVSDKYFATFDELLVHITNIWGSTFVAFNIYLFQLFISPLMLGTSIFIPNFN